MAQLLELFVTVFGLEVTAAERTIQCPTLCRAVQHPQRWVSGGHRQVPFAADGVAFKMRQRSFQLRFMATQAGTLG